MCSGSLHFPLLASLCLPNYILLCVNLHLYVFFVLSHYKDSSNVRKPLETGHRCSSSSSLPVIHDPSVFLLGPQLYPPQPQFLSPDVLMPSMAGEPHRLPGNSPKSNIICQNLVPFQGPHRVKSVYLWGRGYPKVEWCEDMNYCFKVMH